MLHMMQTPPLLTSGNQQIDWVLTGLNRNSFLSFPTKNIINIVVTTVARVRNFAVVLVT